MADVIAPRYLRQRLTRSPWRQRFLLLMLCKLGAAAEPETSGLSANPTVRRPAQDQMSFQKAKGVTAQAVYQSADNPNDITVTHEFGSVEAAQAFANSDELKKAMQGAGVVGAPTIWVTNKV